MILVGIEESKSKYTNTQIVKESEVLEGLHFDIKVYANKIRELQVKSEMFMGEINRECEDYLDLGATERNDLDLFGAFVSKINDMLCDFNKSMSTYASTDMSFINLSNSAKIQVCSAIEGIEEERMYASIHDIFTRIPVCNTSYINKLSNIRSLIEILYMAITTTDKTDVRNLEISRYKACGAEVGIFGSKKEAHIGELKEKLIDMIMNLNTKIIEPLGEVKSKGYEELCRIITLGLPKILDSNYDGVKFSNTDIDGECLATIYTGLNLVDINNTALDFRDIEHLGTSKKITRDDYIDIEGLVSLYPHIIEAIVYNIANFYSDVITDISATQYMLYNIPAIMRD